MLRRLTRAAAMLTALLCLPACVQRIYEVRISPRTDAVGWDRVLTVTETRTEKNAQGQSIPTQDRRITTSMFTRDIDSDMGNAGSITSYPTTLGTLSVYIERFRGQSAVADGLEARLHAAEECARLMGGWLRSEAENWPQASRLETWCSTELARDLRDLSVHVWLTGVDRGGASDPAYSSGWLRVSQFLTERGYLESGDLPQITRLLMGGADSDSAHHWFVRMLARKAGDRKVVGGDDPPAFLRSWQSITASLEEYLRSQPEFDALVARLESEAKPNEDPRPADPKQILGDQLGAMVAGMVPLFANEAGSWSETLDLQITVPGEPFATNGRWRSEDKAVRWMTMLDGPDEKSMYPLNAFAQWVTANDAAQERAFGSVVLRGVNLAKYCLWRTGLTEAEGHAWDDAVASLNTGSNAPDLLREAGSRAGIPQPLLDSGISIIRDVIDRAAPGK